MQNREVVALKSRDVRAQAYSMPLTSPACPRGPHRFVDREYLIITYRTDPDRLRGVVPQPLEFHDPLVQFEFIRMPDSAGFGSYIESGQVIPVRFNDVIGGYSHAMYLDDGPPILGGRELWGFPKKYAHPAVEVYRDTLVGTLDYGPVRIATGTMGFKHWALDDTEVLASLCKPTFLLKIIPHVDGSLRVCELVSLKMEDVILKGAWGGPASLDLRPHALAPVADLPVLEVVSAAHFIADLTLDLGTVVHDYLAEPHTA